MRLANILCLMEVQGTKSSDLTYRTITGPSPIFDYKTFLDVIKFRILAVLTLKISACGLLFSRQLVY